jgi:uncharacterized Fe-S center protein
MKAKVYFLPVRDGLTTQEQAAAMSRLYDAAAAEQIINAEDFVAIKIHVGEKNNTTHIKPELVKEVVDKVKTKGGHPFITETSTLYKGERENAVKHILHAHRHGFSIENLGAPFIPADGLAGNTEYEVEINGILHEKVKIAREVAAADAMIIVSHPTGHPMAGIGATLKNLGMGLASRLGKMRQHSSALPLIGDECKFCQKCIKWCPQGAIVEKEGKAFIVAEKCIGCGECLAVCHFSAVTFNWDVESGFMQKSMAEHAYGAIVEKREKCFYFNVMIDMTADCDCFSVKQEKVMPDVGILASTDPVAIDVATLDLTAKVQGKTLAEVSHGELDARIQIEHAVKIGMGTEEYELIRV